MNSLTIMSAPVSQISFTIFFWAAAELNWESVKAHSATVSSDSAMRSNANDLSTLAQKSLWVTVQFPVAISYRCISIPFANGIVVPLTAHDSLAQSLKSSSILQRNVARECCIGRGSLLSFPAGRCIAKECQSRPGLCVRKSLDSPAIYDTPETSSGLTPKIDDILDSPVVWHSDA